VSFGASLSWDSALADREPDAERDREPARDTRDHAIALQLVLRRWA